MSGLGRLKKEAHDLVENPLEWGSAEPVGGDLFKWTATVLGPEGSPYQGGIFTLSFTLPTEYPFKAPDVVFVTKVYHPNVNQSTGEICADLLKEQWKPSLNLKWVLGVIRSMLQSPSADSPLEEEIASQLKNDRDAFDKNAAKWTKQYAT